MPFDAYFIRHAESLANTGHPTDDPSTIPLTDTGRRQADEFAASVSIVPAIIAFSPFERARQTAEPLLARFPLATHLSLPIHEFTYLSPAAWRDTTGAQRRPAVDKYWHQADPHFCDGPGAESFSDFFIRVERTFDWLDQQSAHPIFLVCHELFIRGVLWRCLSPSFEQAISTMQNFRPWQLATSLPNASVTRVSCSASGEIVISLPFRLTPLRSAADTSWTRRPN